MALLKEAIEEKKLDVRVLEKHLARGVVKNEVLESALKRLPDDSDNAEWISLETLEQLDPQSLK